MMWWGNSGYHWASVGAGLLTAFFATVGAVWIFVTDLSQETNARRFTLAAGRIEPEYIDEPTALVPAPEPITITLTIDRSAPVLSFLEEAGLDRDEARRWAWSFERTSESDVLQCGHS